MAVLRGRFITLEGGEGVGKTTNLAFVCDWLKERGIDCLMTREPGGTPLAEDIRELLLCHREETVSDLTELLLIFAARAQHIEQVIKPALAAGQWVLCDRFTDATFAYQGGGRQMDWACIETLQQLVQGTLQPDMTLYLDMAVGDGLKRVRQRGVPDRFESQDESFFHRVREAYQRRAQGSPERFRSVDASQPLDAVQRQLAAVLEQFWSSLERGDSLEREDSLERGDSLERRSDSDLNQNPGESSHNG